VQDVKLLVKSYQRQLLERESKWMPSVSYTFRVCVLLHIFAFVSVQTHVLGSVGVAVVDTPLRRGCLCFPPLAERVCP